jgi:hypothetical protein
VAINAQISEIKANISEIQVGITKKTGENNAKIIYK